MAPTETAAHAPGAVLQHTCSNDTSECKPAIAIREFQREDEAQVLELFRDGIMSGTKPSDPYYEVVVNYVEHSLGQDLADIAGHYLTRKGSSFFVATADLGVESGRVVVGSIGIESTSDDSVAELRRVSVKAECRRLGIGRLLMGHIEAWARAQGFAKLMLSTAATQVRARKFYHSLGYSQTRTEVFSDEPYFELVYLEKDLVSRCDESD